MQLLALILQFQRSQLLTKSPFFLVVFLFFPLDLDFAGLKLGNLLSQVSRLQPISELLFVLHLFFPWGLSRTDKHWCWPVCWAAQGLPGSKEKVVSYMLGLGSVDWDTGNPPFLVGFRRVGE